MQHLAQTANKIAEMNGRTWLVFAGALIAWVLTACASEPKQATIDVILWFDTEDYILPASDDAALRVASWLTSQDIRATFKVVGEKARTLERRERQDVLAALKRHEIGYHSNWHSVPPSPAQYLNECGWEDGIAEFTRREKPGYDDVVRIFGQRPTCYGQPGSSWAPQTHAALYSWGVRIYLDAGQHVNVQGKPFWYGGLLNFYKLTYQLRVGLNKAEDLEAAKSQFLQARQQLLAEGGGVVSIVYHPCEFVHRQFWDGVNFRQGANPPREAWQLPPTKTPAETKLAYDNFERYVTFMKRHPEVRFVTATEAARDFADPVRGRMFTGEEISRLARTALDESEKHGISWIEPNDLTLSAAEMFWLVVSRLAELNRSELGVSVPEYLAGPGQASMRSNNNGAVSDDELRRAAPELLAQLRERKQIPHVVWVGSRGISPEDYYWRGLKIVAGEGAAEANRERAQLKEGLRLKAQDYVAEDGPHLWKWVIFPEGFRAPQVMAQAKRQAWTLKPARFKRQLLK
jgi:hypothetical protein